MAAVIGKSRPSDRTPHPQDDATELLFRAAFARGQATGFLAHPFAGIMTASRSVVRPSFLNGVRRECRDRAERTAQWLVRAPPAAEPANNNLAAMLASGPTAHTTFNRKADIVCKSMKYFDENGFDGSTPIAGIISAMYHWPNDGNVQTTACLAMQWFLGSLEPEFDRIRTLDQFSALEAITTAFKVHLRGNNWFQVMFAAGSVVAALMIISDVPKATPKDLAKTILAEVLTGSLDKNPVVMQFFFEAYRKNAPKIASKEALAHIAGLAGCLHRNIHHPGLVGQGLLALDLTVKYVTGPAVTFMAQIITNALHAHPTSAHVLGASVLVLFHWLTPANKCRGKKTVPGAGDVCMLLAEGVLSAFHGAFGAQPDADPTFFMQLCNFVIQIAADTERQNAAVQNGAVPLIVGIIEQRWPQAHVPGRALTALQRLAGTKRGSALEHIVDGGGVRAALAAMTTFSTDAELLTNAMAALANLADHGPTQVAVVAAGGIEATIVALQAFSTHVPLVSAGLRLLAVLSQYTGNKALVITHGGISTALAALKMADGPPGLLQQAYWLLANLASNANSFPACTKTARVGRVILAALPRTVQAPDSQAFGLMALAKIAESAKPVLVKGIFAHGAISVVLQSLALHGAHADCVRYGLELVRWGFKKAVEHIPMAMVGEIVELMGVVVNLHPKNKAVLNEGIALFHVICDLMTNLAIIDKSDKTSPNGGLSIDLSVLGRIRNHLEAAAAVV